VTPSAELRDRTLIAFMLSASLASTIGGMPFNLLPVMLGSLADSFALDAQAVGWMGSICFAGYLLGTLGAPLWMNRVNWRLLTVISAAGTALSFALSALVEHVPMLFVMWALIGFFASTMTCLGMRILADLPNKVRAYGVRQGVELSVTAAVLFALPPLVIAHFKYPGAALALAGVVVLLGVSSLWVPKGPPVALTVHDGHALSAPLQGSLPSASWWALGVFFLFLVGNIGLWAFLERIGAVLKIAPTEMGLVFAVLKLLGGVAAFFVASLGERGGHRWPYGAVLLGVTLGLVLLAKAEGFLPFALGAWIWEFAFTCGCVYQVAAIARSDASGRAVMLVPAAFALGSMVGPGLAGQLVAGGSFTSLLGLALLSTLAPVVASFWVRQPAVLSVASRRGA
jgi:predicted MFS family arabinose efflux permease